MATAAPTSSPKPNCELPMAALLDVVAAAELAGEVADDLAGEVVDVPLDGAALLVLLAMMAGTLR